ncbi:hypothetical protein [Haloterrigena salinisoli]|uniref:hypothetical protein n=1 Tax=Haloterrigena salinisoli TaxID=3132747 RepID=UPI0030D5916E
MQCIGRTDDMLIYKGMNVFPSAIRDVISDVDGALPHVRVVLPETGKVHFEEPIPVNVVIDPETDRDPAAVADDAAGEVRSQLRARIDPNPVSLAEIELSEYKSELVVVKE